VIAEGSRFIYNFFSIFGGAIVMLSYLCAVGFRQWHESLPSIPSTEGQKQPHKSFAFVPWLFKRTGNYWVQRWKLSWFIF